MNDYTGQENENALNYLLKVGKTIGDNKIDEVIVRHFNLKDILSL